jgi:plastocyanin
MPILTRRIFVAGGAAALADAVQPATICAARQTETVEIKMLGDHNGRRVWFEPIGLFLQPGQIVRWVCVEGEHTTCAYHPDNDHHSLRIPQTATPWSSGYLQADEKFEIRLTEEGVYDFFCQPHEKAGMVGRIIVGRATGPGANPFDYFKQAALAKDWRDVPLAAQQAFPSINKVLRRGRVSVV